MTVDLSLKGSCPGKANATQICHSHCNEEALVHNIARSLIERRTKSAMHFR